MYVCIQICNVFLFIFSLSLVDDVSVLIECPVTEVPLFVLANERLSRNDFLPETIRSLATSRERRANSHALLLSGIASRHESDSSRVRED